MKKLYFILFALLMSFVAEAQNLPIDQGTNKVTFLEVVDATGVSPADLFKVAKEWGVGKGYTVKEEVANEKIVFDGYTEVDYPNVSGAATEKGKVKFTFSIFIKDGKYRYIMTDFVHESANPKAAANGGKLENVSPECGSSKMSAKAWVMIKNKTGTNAKLITEDLKRVVKEFQNNPANKSDW